MVAAEAEVHTLLKTGALTLAHFDVGNDVVAHGAFLDAQRRANRRCAALSHSVQRLKGARLSAGLGGMSFQCLDGFRERRQP